MLRSTVCGIPLKSPSKLLKNIAKPKLEDYLANCDRQTLDLVASFQRAVVEDLVGKTLAAARAYDVATLFVTGGVAANSELRSTFEQAGAQEGIAGVFPLAGAFHRQCRNDCRGGLSLNFLRRILLRWIFG
jgi:hydrogenase maturation factor HypF (carbamoyltransferase family)